MKLNYDYNSHLMTCYAQDSLLLPNYLENDGFYKSVVNDQDLQFKYDLWRSKEKYRWTSIDNWKNETVVNFTANHIHLQSIKTVKKISNGSRIPSPYHLVFTYNNPVTLYFGLLEAPSIKWKKGKFWVSTGLDPKQYKRCIVSLLGRTVCYFNDYGVNVMFGQQLLTGWPAIMFDNRKFFVYF